MGSTLDYSPMKIVDIWPQELAWRY